MRLLLLLLLAACACSGSGSSRDACPVLHVLAAQSLEPTLRDFAVGRSDVRISYGASGLLLRQLERGAPAGLFLSAGATEAELAAAGGTPVVFAANRLVLAVPAGNPAGIGAPADLAALEGRIAIGRAPLVPGGRYAREALAILGIAAAVEARLVEAETTPQALAWLRGGQVEAAIVYRSDARAADDAVRVVAELPTRTPIRYPAVILPGPCAQKAQAFVEELRRSPALTAHGFERP